MIDKFLKWLTPTRYPVAAITDSTIDLIMETAKETHPKEMLGILRTEKASKINAEQYTEDPTDRIIVGFNIPPDLMTSSTKAVFSSKNMPINNRNVGVVHSHPNGVIRPSNEDVNSGFSTGSIHIIAGHPYGEDDWKAFESNGNETVLRVIPHSQIEYNPAEKFEQYESDFYSES